MTPTQYNMPPSPAMFYSSLSPIFSCLQAPYQSKSWYSSFHVKEEEEEEEEEEENVSFKRKLIKLMFAWMVGHQALL